MKRKIIRQKDSYTITLPKKWVREKGLEGKEEVEVKEIEGKLILSTETKEERNIVNIDISSETESLVRTIISNAYRSGYDILRVKFANQAQLELINNIVSKNLMGFDILETKDNICIIENIAEPNVDEFNSIFIKILQIISVHFDFTIEALENGKVDLIKNEEFSQKTQLYDSFCRRAMSKKRLTERRTNYYWAFFSIIGHADRKLFRLNKDFASLKIKVSKEVISLLKEAKVLFTMLKDAYTKGDMKYIQLIHDKEKDLIYTKGYALLKKKSDENIILYSILDVIRNSYLANSALQGILLS